MTISENDDAVGLTIWKRADQHGVDDRERGRRCPNAKREGDQRDGREARRSPVRAQREPDVAREIVQPRQPACVANGFLEARLAPELLRRECTSGCRVDALRLMPSCLHLEVEAQFLVELALESERTHPGAKPPQRLPNHPHGRLTRTAGRAESPRRIGATRLSRARAGVGPRW